MNDDEPTILMGFRLPLDGRTFAEIARDKPPVNVKADFAAMKRKILHAPPLVLSAEQFRRWGHILGVNDTESETGN